MQMQTSYNFLQLILIFVCQTIVTKVIPIVMIENQVQKSRQSQKN